MTNEEKINLIGKKILLLSNNLDNYKAELNQLQHQLNIVQQQSGLSKKPIITPDSKIPAEPVREIVTAVNVSDFKVEITEINTETPIKIHELVISEIPNPQINTPFAKHEKETKSAFNFEEFIGSKLITIIGIVILVIGMGIGVKYAIDQDLLGPLARIVLAYSAGGILLALALKLKNNYKTFSAVLLSGGMASLYFTTFAAYSMYNLFPQLAAFAIMVIFTGFTVFAATVYSLEVIGIIGLVGAYAVPMLLSDGTGKIEIMFSYMLILNAGILFLSFKKLWRILNHIAFGFTWLIVITWFVSKYNYDTHAAMAMTFSFLFFIIFYISNLAYKIFKQEQFDAVDVIRIVLNSLIFFGLGYAALNNELYQDYLGLFALINSIVHLVFSYIVFKNKLLDRKLFYLLIALVLSFLTIAVPVQLEGNWVTLLWSAEALFLFVIGRYKNVRFYEWLAFIMVLFAVFSLLHDWDKTYYSYQYFRESSQDGMPFLNIQLFTSLFFTASLGAVVYIHHKKNISIEERSKYGIYKISEYAFPILLFIFTYLSFNNEITAFFQTKFDQSLLKTPSKEAWAEPGAISEVYDYSWLNLKEVSFQIYNLVFFCIMSLCVILKWKNNILSWSVSGLNIFAASIFIFLGLYQLGSLRDYYLNADNAVYFSSNSMFIYVRYVCFALFGLLLYLTHLILKTEPFKESVFPKIYSGSIIHLFILILLSNELIHLNVLHNYGIDESYYAGTKAVYKLGLTALWGIYSFLLIAFGIFRKNQVARISAISLFGITLIKLVTFDTWDLSTGYKVIAYMLLGIILLVVAFLYQKFKVLIFGDSEPKLSEGNTP